MTMTRSLRFGTRASLLARTQTASVVSSLSGPVETVLVSTEGDRSSAPLTQLGGTGVFVSALREALLRGDIDVAVHSFKDLPTAPADGIALAAVPAREDARDALCSRDGLTLLELPAGSRVGTGSPRRAAQLRALDLGFEIVPIRGNIDTRLAKVGRPVSEGGVDAVVLAVAGLRRIDLSEKISEILDPIQVLPAPAQGALAIECRADDPETMAALAGLDDPSSRAAVQAERALLAGLEAGCSAPVGALAEITEGDAGQLEIFLRGSVTAIDGADAVRLSATGDVNTAEQVGRQLAAELIDLGANRMMGSS